MVWLRGAGSGSSEMIAVTDEATGDPEIDENGEAIVERDGYRRTNRGTKRSQDYGSG